MTPQDYENALDKLQKKHDNNLVQLGRMLYINDDILDRNAMLKRSIDKLTTCNKSLTTQLAKAKERALRLVDTKTYLIDVIEAARKISPEVSARIDEIKDEVNRSYNETNK